MSKMLLLAILFVLPFSLPAQEKTLQHLYEKVMNVYENIQHGEHLKALESADGILEEYFQYPGSEKYKAYLYMYKAEAYLRLGDNLLSELCSNIARNLAEESGENSIFFTIENNLAALDIEKHDYADCFEKCEMLLNNSDLDPTKDQLGMVLNNMVLSAFKTNRLIAADSLFKKLFELSQDSFKNVQFDRFLPYRNFGLYLMQQDQLFQACTFLETAFQLYQEKLGPNHFETLRSKLYLGECLQKIGKPDSALICLNETIMELEPDNKHIRPAEYETLLINSYQARAEFWLSIADSRDQEMDIRLRKSALDDLGKATDRIQFIMRTFSASESGYTIARIGRPVYNMAVSVSISLYRLTHDRGYFFRALVFSDQAKKMSLFARSFANRQIQDTPALEKRSQAFYKSRQTLTDFNPDAAKAHNKPEMNDSLMTILHEYSNIKKSLDSLLGFQRYSQFSDFQDFKWQSVFKRNTLISYHDQDSIIQAMILKGDEIQEFSINKSPEFKEKIRTFKERISIPRPGSYSQKELLEFIELSQFLYSQLIQPITALWPGQKLFIQSDGVLAGLPFGILLPEDLSGFEETEIKSFRELPYLLKGNPVFYLSSIYPIREGGAKKNEVSHFDGHANIDLVDYSNSELESGLDWQSIISESAGYKSIYLNGCETGLGPYYSGEGLMSLGLAFLLSGADQVIENFWMAPESSSATLAAEFYKNRGFEKPAKALKKAKLAYLGNAPDGLDHPHYWAGTMVQGKATAKNNRLLLFLILALFPLVVIIKMVKNPRSEKDNHHN